MSHPQAEAALLEGDTEGIPDCLAVSLLPTTRCSDDPSSSLLRDGVQGELVSDADCLTGAEDDPNAEELRGSGVFGNARAPRNRNRPPCRGTWAAVRQIICALLVAGYCVYLSAAMIINWKRASGLVFTSLLALLWRLRSLIGRPLALHAAALVAHWGRAQRWALMLFATAVVCASLIFIVLVAIDNPRRLMAILGLVVFHGVAVACSTDIHAIKWRPALWGLLLQFAVALFILRTSVGVALFTGLGDAVNRCLDFSDIGARFVFGDKFEDHFFAFKILPTVTFFSALSSVLYYLGVMQVLIRACAAVMSETIAISPCETIVAAANIFVGMTTAPLLVRPLLPQMTPSELHSMMVTGFATMTGSMIAVYGALDVPTSHLIAASVMSAPAALAMSKLVCPEDRSPTPLKDWTMASEERNVLEALSKGAMDSISLVANIVVMLITFIGMIALGDAVLSWLGSLVNFPQLSFNTLCSFAFLPFALVMGVEWNDAFTVASLLGTKTIVNEFVAYTQLSVFIKAGTLSDHSIVLSSYALCGFSNLGGIGMMIAMFTMLVPLRVAEVAALAPRALLAGTLACFSTACVAGLLYDASEPMARHPSGH
eukprot:GGOE01041147.1.p1 GENE.GGOE01041147.1~~GGOE01041147.1.p1  ORF type:complete len:607 (+),score=132.04 GGOE01041147.1:23-1822(+)